jgi:urea transporter
MLLLQVVFANNPISGILIFMALTVADPLVSAAGLLTASAGLLASIVVSADSTGWAVGSLAEGWIS